MKKKGFLSHPLKITMGVANVCNILLGFLGWVAESTVRSSWAAFSLAAKVVVLGGCHFHGWSYLETYEPRKKDQPVARHWLGTHQVVVWFAQVLLCGQHASNARDWVTKPEHARCHWWISNLLDGIEWNCNSMAIHFGNGSNSLVISCDFRHFPQQDSILTHTFRSWGRKGCWELCFPFLGCKTCGPKGNRVGILWYSHAFSFGQRRQRGTRLPCKILPWPWARNSEGKEPMWSWVRACRFSAWREMADPSNILQVRSRICGIGVGPCGWPEPSITDSFWMIFRFSSSEFNTVWACLGWFYPTLKHWCHGIHMAYITFPAFDPARRQVMIPTWDLSSPGPMSRACSRKACWASWSTGFLTARRRAEVPLIGAHGGAGAQSMVSMV